MKCLVSLVAILLCGCGTENKASNQPAQASIASVTGDEQTSAQNSKSIGLGEYVVFPTCGVKLRHPEDFQKALNFDGFGQPNTHSSIVVVRISGPFSNITAGFTESEMKKRGWNLLGKQNADVEGLRGVLVNFEQPSEEQVYLKWSLVFGDEYQTTLVTATMPKIYEQELSARLKAALMSTRLDSTRPPKLGSDLPFKLESSNKLKLTPAMNKMLAYTKEGAIPTKSPQDPLFVVAPGLVDVETKNRRQFAEQQLFSTAQTKEIVVRSFNPISIDALDGYEIIADAKDANTGVPVIVYQVILFNGNSPIGMVGLVGTALGAEYVPEFKTMARSFRRIEP